MALLRKNKSDVSPGDVKKPWFDFLCTDCHLQLKPLVHNDTMGANVLFPRKKM